MMKAFKARTTRETKQWVFLKFEAFLSSFWEYVMIAKEHLKPGDSIDFLAFSLYVNAYNIAICVFLNHHSKYFS